MRKRQYARFKKQEAAINAFNKWFDSLKEPWRFLFVVLVVLPWIGLSGLSEMVLFMVAVPLPVGIAIVIIHILLIWFSLFFIGMRLVKFIWNRMEKK